MGETTRAFVALVLPPAALDPARAVLRELRARPWADAVKCVPPGNLHATLRFFGDLDPPALARARAWARSLDGAFAPVASGWTELGAFPSPRRPQVIWLGLADPRGALRALAARIDEGLRREGFGRADKPFAAHVTLGRVRRDRRVDWSAASDRLTIPAAAFSIRTIVLFKSRLTPAGAEHTPLETATARDQAPSDNGTEQEGEQP
ncbi:MAG: RNA 2',3'-cyclic phosphodiesterase [Candidatus Eisenbacteria bacterium]|uniref:RNA 2',3'-cyclic phosphodiesterase n=1 Tax=Eiseniibacteriota bacterium TaxID=2212470 RepID=A0A938BPU4_UNCEI|nr:RNA 2',3'-cyclic phosphodiesterase [Candidatus Eisenbacteria bacterium]